MSIPEVGKPLDRIDGRRKTSGGARYAAEHNLENMTYGALVMSTIPAGTIKSIDASAALKSSGVIAVISHLNAPKLNGPKQPPPGPQQQQQQAAQANNLAEPRNIPFQDD